MNPNLRKIDCRVPLLAAALLLAVFLPGRPAAAQTVDYGRDIAPILSEACYHCHGPDTKARKAKLRLDTKEGAFRVKDDVAVLVAGKPEASELIRRVASHDPEVVMPPAESNRTLTPQQIDLLNRWVAQGAKWGTHWAFVPPVRMEPPQTKRQGWSRNPIDAYVLAALEKQGLKPAPEAKRETLIRRVTLDLTGLPPTPAEIDAFVADASPEAYEKVVDRLLASPRYGERMAVDWLDLARFADTHGYQSDRYRAVWPYRDWVIKAFNENLPFDQFATWQLAGDLLPNATKEQRLATAFNRLHMQNEEGGIVEEEFRVAYVVDRVDTMGTAFMGLTFECSRCHDHKYDPITQKDFYSLYSIFQNVDESGQTSFFTDPTPVPTLLLSTEAQDAKLAELKQDIGRHEAKLASIRAAAGPEFEKWLAARPPAPAIPLGRVAHLSFDDLPTGHVVNADAPKSPVNITEGPKSIDGKVGKAAELSGENGFSLPGIGHFTRADGFSLAMWLNAPAHAPRMVVAHHSRAPIDAGSRGHELLLEDGHVAFGLHHMWPGNSLKVVTQAALPIDSWAHVAVTYDGCSRAAGVRVYLNGISVPLDVVRDGLTKDISYGGSEPDLTIGNRFRDNGFKGGKVDEFDVFNRPLTALEVAQLAGQPDLQHSAPAALDAPVRGALLDYFVATVYPPALDEAKELHTARDTQRKFIEPIAEIMAMQELPTPKPAYILKRGAYDAHGEAVVGNTPGFLPPLAANQPHNRLGLARWLVSPENPLMARVTVNRFWQQAFGQGIVETSDNLGSQGAQPTHPEILDFLARTFVDDLHWDVKRVMKLIVTSATYRQSSAVSADLLARDPSNQLLARGPARRLTAEMLRDQSLADAGLLVERLGGPSVKPYQPDGVWDVASGSPHYDRGQGADLYRRSLYTYWKRTVPPPTMMVFDAADRSVCTAHRQSTSTPLQALVLLNDPQVVEAARLVSQRMMKEGGASPEARIAWTFRLLTGRAPTAREGPILRRLFDEQRTIFAADRAAAAKLLAVGDTRADPSLDPIDLAAGTVLAEALFSSDDAVMRR